MEVNFGNPAGSAPAPTVPVAEVTPTPTAVATVPKPALPATNKLLLGDTLPRFQDAMIPRLNIVQGSGNLKDAFPQGALVFNQNTVLHTPAVIDRATGNASKAATAPIKLYVVGIISKRYAEKVQGGMGGMIVNTEDDVRANGGTLDYKEWQLKKSSGMRRFEDMVDLLLLIERPELVKDDGLVFNWDRAGAKFCLAAWTVKGAAYTAVMKKVLNPGRLFGILKDDGYPSYSFTLGTRLETFKLPDGSFTAWVPVIVPAAKTSPEVFAFIHEIVDSPVA